MHPLQGNADDGIARLRGAPLGNAEAGNGDWPGLIPDHQRRVSFSLGQLPLCEQVAQQLGAVPAREPDAVSRFS